MATKLSALGFRVSIAPDILGEAVLFLTALAIDLFQGAVGSSECTVGNKKASIILKDNRSRLNK